MYAQYSHYLKHFRSESTNEQYLTRIGEVTAERKASPAASMKTLLAIHAYLHTARQLKHPEEILGLLNHVLAEMNQQISVRRSRKSSEKLASHSAVFIREGVGMVEQVESEKEIYLL